MLSVFELVSGLLLIVGLVVRPLSLAYAFLLWSFVVALPVMTAPGTTDKTWLRSCYFYDPDGIMLELCATLQAGSPHVELPVNADGIKANGEGVVRSGGEPRTIRRAKARLLTSR
jgi:hypothetical protein